MSYDAYLDQLQDDLYGKTGTCQECGCPVDEDQSWCEPCARTYWAKLERLESKYE